MHEMTVAPCEYSPPSTQRRWRWSLVALLICALAPRAYSNEPKILPVFINQIGYSSDLPKRFTTPTVTAGAFEIANVLTGEVVHAGEIRDGIGDFTVMSPETEQHAEYVISVVDKQGRSGQSDPFAIEPRLILGSCLEPAIRFMVDSRSIVGTHPSAYGGMPWRDGTYYSYEVPSLVLLYLSSPAECHAMPTEINWKSDRKHISSPDFHTVAAAGDDGAFEAAKAFYASFDPPQGKNVPDIVQLIHWGIGWHLVKPSSRDPSNDPLPHQIHAQTIEQFAYFLYAYPAYAEYVPDAFYRRAEQFAFDQWARVGLLKVISEVGDYKGRHCPGHSVMPNLLMYEVATRRGRDDARQYLNAAVAQAAWVVDTLNPADPMVMKGQRMSEHKLMTGLVMLQQNYADLAPPALRDWIARWTQTVIARSDNMWDFRKFDDALWTIPRDTGQDPTTSGGAGWNEPGNIAAFPALCLAVAGITENPQQRQRLVELAAAHFDHLFGRNPVGAASCADGPAQFPGVERGWPVHFPADRCARLERVRGVIHSSAAHEHFPFNPDGDFRHPEGWTAFNAALNVGLAYTAFADRQDQRGALSEPQWAVLQDLRAPFTPVEVTRP